MPNPIGLTTQSKSNRARDQKPKGLSSFLVGTGCPLLENNVKGGFKQISFVKSVSLFISKNPKIEILKYPKKEKCKPFNG